MNTLDLLAAREAMRLALEKIERELEKVTTEPDFGTGPDDEGVMGGPVWDRIADACSEPEGDDDPDDESDSGMRVLDGGVLVRKG